MKCDFSGQEIEDGLYDEIEEIPAIPIQDQLPQYLRVVLLHSSRLTNELQRGFDTLLDAYIPPILNLSRERLTEFLSSLSQIFDRLPTNQVKTTELVDIPYRFRIAWNTEDGAASR